MMIDSNIIVYSLNLDSAKCDKAQTFLQKQKKLVLSQQNILETLRIITHQKFPHPFSVSKALKELTAIQNSSIVIMPGPTTLTIAFQLISRYQIRGPEVFDAYLAATALSNGIREIASDNVKHLGKYKEIKVINPFMVD